MNNTGFFFCGLLVGVVVSAAFGLDFFPAVDLGAGSGSSTLGSANQAGPDGAPAQVGEPARLAAELGAATLKVTSLEKKLAAAESTVEAKEAQVTMLEARLKTTGPDDVSKLAQARGDLAQERQRAKRLEADLELSHGETYNLLKQFFASKRSPNDAILISAYFATSAPEKLKGDLVDQLLQTNRDVIASLSPAGSLLAGSGLDRVESGLAPVSSKTGASEPKAAVLKEGEPENLDPQQKSDASDPSTSDPTVSDESKAVRLPPPPGEKNPPGK